MNSRPANRVTQVLWLLFVVTILGCGGIGGGNHSSGPTSEPVVQLTTSLSLPSTISGTNSVILSSGSEIVSPGTSARLTALAGSPTLVSVLDKTDRRLMMIGVVDPSLTSNTIDTANMAAAIVYLGIGGSQLPPEERTALLNRIKAHSSVVSLATLLSSQLSTNRYAWANADATLKAQIIATLDAVLSGEVPPSRSTEKTTSSTTDAAKSRSKTREIPPAPDPSVILAIRSGNSLGLPQILPGKIGGVTYPDYIQMTESSLRETERAVYLFENSFDNAVLKAEVFLPSFNGFKEEVVFGPVPIPLTNPSHEEESINYFSLFPVFDAPDFSIIDSLPAIHAQALRNQQKNLWKRAVVRISSDILLETLGYGGVSYTIDEIGQLTAGFENVNSAFGSVVNASSDGKTLVAHLDAFLAAASSNETNAQAALTVLKTVVPELSFVSPNRLTAAQQLLSIAGQQGLSNYANTHGTMVTYHQYDGEGVREAGYSNVTNLSQGPIIVKRYEPNLRASTTTYTPGGSPIEMTVLSSNNDYITQYKDILVFKWKVFGTGEATLTDGTRTGKEFESSKSQVIFESGSSASGAQNVGVEVYLKQGSSKRLWGKKTIILNSTENGTLSVGGGVQTPWAPLIEGNISSHRNGQQITSWPGVNSANLRFHWELQNGSTGKLQSNGMGVTTLDTTTSTAPFKGADSAQGTSEVLTLTVRAVDPATGQFTVLGSATTTIITHVLGRARMGMLPSFNESLFETPGLIRNCSPIGDNVLSLSNGQYFAIGNYGSVGARDRFYISVPIGSNPQIDDTISIGGGSEGILDQWFYFNENPFVAFNSTTGTATIKEVQRNNQGRVSYVRLKIESHWKTTLNTLPIECRIDVGVGSYDSSQPVIP